MLEHPNATPAVWDRVLGMTAHWAWWRRRPIHEALARHPELPARPEALHRLVTDLRRSLQEIKERRPERRPPAALMHLLGRADLGAASEAMLPLLEALRPWALNRDELLSLWEAVAAPILAAVPTPTWTDLLARSTRDQRLRVVRLVGRARATVTPDGTPVTPDDPAPVQATAPEGPGAHPDPHQGGHLAARLAARPPAGSGPAR